MTKTKPLTRKPNFKNEDEEAQWWASANGRSFLKQQPAAPTSKKRGSPLVSKLNRTSSIQIALRLPEPDVAQARQIAERKGIGYQTLLKMLVHEGLRKEARRK